MLDEIESVAVRACEAGVPHVKREGWYVAATTEDGLDALRNDEVASMRGNAQVTPGPHTGTFPTTARKSNISGTVFLPRCCQQ